LSNYCLTPQCEGPKRPRLVARKLGQVRDIKRGGTRQHGVVYVARSLTARRRHQGVQRRPSGAENRQAHLAQDVPLKRTWSACAAPRTFCDLDAATGERTHCLRDRARARSPPRRSLFCRTIARMTMCGGMSTRRRERWITRTAAASIHRDIKPSNIMLTLASEWRITISESPGPIRKYPDRGDRRQSVLHVPSKSSDRAHEPFGSVLLGA